MFLIKIDTHRVTVYSRTTKNINKTTVKLRSIYMREIMILPACTLSLFFQLNQCCTRNSSFSLQCQVLYTFFILKQRVPTDSAEKETSLFRVEFQRNNRIIVATGSVGLSMRTSVSIILTSLVTFEDLSFRITHTACRIRHCRPVRSRLLALSIRSPEAQTKLKLVRTKFHSLNFNPQSHFFNSVHDTPPRFQGATLGEASWNFLRYETMDIGLKPSPRSSLEIRPPAGATG